MFYVICKGISESLSKTKDLILRLRNSSLVVLSKHVPTVINGTIGVPKSEVIHRLITVAWKPNSVYSPHLK